jgi:hypothetical protein
MYFSFGVVYKFVEHCHIPVTKENFWKNLIFSLLLPENRYFHRQKPSKVQ